MSHFSDFMDGVPVKISEKYKRPPKRELPYSITESPSRAQYCVDNVKYCSTFEENVLKKLQELRSAKETKRNERKHRIQLLEESKQKKLDAIAAAEAEEKLKQLSISEVSYPSTEEISTLSTEDKIEEPCDTPVDDIGNVAEPNNEVPLPPCNSSSNPPLNILQPIQAHTNYQQNNLLDDPDPLQHLKLNRKVILPQYRKVDTLTFKDFENDTSSPFDNIELKTINDMELLAQVLKNEQETSNTCPQQYTSPNMYMQRCGSQAQDEGITYIPNYVEQITNDGNMYPQQYAVSNGYYVAPTNDSIQVPIDNINMYSNYQYYVPPNQYQSDTNYYNIMPTTSGEVLQTQNEPNYIPQPFYYHYPHLQQYTANLPYNVAGQSENMEQNPTSPSQNTIKSRSRSVPDIVKELNEELASAKLRATEMAYIPVPSPATKVQPQASTSNEKKEERVKRKIEHLPNPFEKLPPTAQQMCKKIHGMGFPLDRVARVCTLVGDNDKKVIEGLLLLGELMDLGFQEGRVCAALAKNEFNRDKALDELVS